MCNKHGSKNGESFTLGMRRIRGFYGVATVVYGAQKIRFNIKYSKTGRVIGTVVWIFWHPSLGVTGPRVMSLSAAISAVVGEN